MKICFFGVGGVGGYFGSLMVNKLKEEHEIFFIARGEHMQAIRNNGLLLKKSGGEEEIIARPTVCTDTVDNLPLCDIIILSVKSYDLENAAKQISKIANDKTIILPLLNGVDISDRLRKHLKTGIVLQSCVYVGTHIECPGVIFQKGGSCKIHMGPDPDYTEVFPEKLLELLRLSDISFEWEPNVSTSIWNKYIFIAAFGLVTAAYNKTLGQVVQDQVLADRVKAIMQEMEDIAVKLNVPLAADVVNASFGKAAHFPAEAKTSFQRDVESKGRINEGDLFGGTLIRFGKSLGIPTPQVKEVYSRLQANLV